MYSLRHRCLKSIASQRERRTARRTVRMQDMEWVCRLCCRHSARTTSNWWNLWRPANGVGRGRRRKSNIGTAETCFTTSIASLSILRWAISVTAMCLHAPNEGNLRNSAAATCYRLIRAYKWLCYSSILLSRRSILSSLNWWRWIATDWHHCRWP